MLMGNAALYLGLPVTTANGRGGDRVGGLQQKMAKRRCLLDPGLRRGNEAAVYGAVTNSRHPPRSLFTSLSQRRRESLHFVTPAKAGVQWVEAVSDLCLLLIVSTAPDKMAKRHRLLDPGLRRGNEAAAYGGMTTHLNQRVTRHNHCAPSKTLRPAPGSK